MDWDAVNQQIEQGFINRREHPNGGLWILNYAPKTQIEWHWTPETRACRGLIVDNKNNVVARPFEKFFSYSQLDGVVPDEPFEAYEKMDGSLGIVYCKDDTPFVSTRGSFESEQSVAATEMLHGTYGHVQLNPEITYLVEIIYPSNRIVVDYGQESKLVLLGMIETATGQELPLEDIGLPVVERHNISDLDVILSEQHENREGFVLRFESGQRVKIKFEEYERLHKIVTGLTPRNIWELLRSGQSIKDMLHKVPDEFYEWATGIEIQLSNRFREVRHDCRMKFDRRPKDGSRKEIAEFFKDSPDKSILFAMLDQKRVDDLIWKAVRPEPQNLAVSLNDLHSHEIQENEISS